MCNCGSKRNNYLDESSAGRDNDPVFEHVLTNTWDKDCYFEYIGKTALTVVGNNTGKYYRFYSTGQAQLIHFSDVDGMRRVGVLKMIQE